VAVQVAKTFDEEIPTHCDGNWRVHVTWIGNDFSNF
jgi:hypothetical protein